MTLNEKTEFIISELEKLYPGATCSLIYTKPYELLIATRLSAQCTDARVNIVTKVLFERFPTLEAMAEAEVSEIEEIVKPCGLFRTKAKSISELSKMLISEHDGVLPDSIEELTRLPGIGRKTANLIMGDIYHQPAVVADTHCIRITNKLGLSHSKDPHKVEKELREILPPDKSNDFCHRMVMFGRDVCIARRPKCKDCPLNSVCENKE